MEKKLPIFELLIDETDTEVTAISLVDRPAIQRNFMKFSEDQPGKVKQNFKFNDERRIITGAIMLADEPIYRNDNGFEYLVTFSPDTIMKIVQKVFRKGYHNNVNLQHNGDDQLDGVTMFESWIVDPSRGINGIDGVMAKPGSWMGSFHIENDRAWEMAKSDEIRGFSIEGVFNYKKQLAQPEQMMANIIDVLNQIQ
jgi:hypothetical protein